MAEAVASIVDRVAPEDQPPGGGKAATTSADRAACPAIVLTVENMHCGGCMRKVEAALSAVSGVSAARANLSARRVTVVPDGPDVSPHGLIEALAAAGFKAGEVRGTAEDAGRSAERDLLYRLAVAGFASANVMLLSVSVWSGEAGGDMSPAVKALFHWLSAMVALPAVVYAGQPFFKFAVSALAAGRLNMDVPISLGVLLAAGMSLYLTLAGDGHIYFDAAVMLLFFLLIGRFLDMRMRVRAAGAASNLLALRALSADVVDQDGTVRRLPAHALQPGMEIQVAPGERIAVDGTIVVGASDIDNSLITGESTPQVSEVGDQVFAGAVNMSGRIVVRAEAIEQNTLLAEIARLMIAAEQGRGQYVRLADRAARIYAPGVHLLGAATFVGWMMIGAGWVPAMTTAIAVLIITCPCALALAVPAVQVAATSRLFERGVLVKAADGLERLAECDTIVFDKTGTLTSGEPRLQVLDDHARRWLGPAASLAITSRHPYARALVTAAEAEGLRIEAVDGVEELPGRGLRCQQDGAEVRLGSGPFCGVPDGARGDKAALWFKLGDADAVPFIFVDAIKSDALETVDRLRAAGFAIELLSGDRGAAVADVAQSLGIGEWRARCSPTDKVARLAELKEAGKTVLMVGDGLNDAPALAAGHASMSPSEAADISQTSADFVFQGGRLAPIHEALAVAHESRRMALQNFEIALAYNMVFVPMAVVGWVTPLIAAIAMSASSIAVTANAVRLRSRSLEASLTIR
ncbi:MAG: heavy metal translocating P-type ATPase [Pseudomonadota bacterium]